MLGSTIARYFLSDGVAESNRTIRASDMAGCRNFVHVVGGSTGCPLNPETGGSKDIKANRLYASKIIGDMTILLDTRKARS